MPRIALMVVTDGRWDYLEQTLDSARQMLRGSFVSATLCNDAGHGTAPEFVKDFDVISGPRLGLAGNIQRGWDHITDYDHLLHLEDDFTFPAPVDVAGMVAHLEADPTLAQVALLRQPWSPEEQQAGSIYATDPASYSECSGLVVHSKLFTFNPCVYPRWVTGIGAGLESEVTAELLAAGAHFAYLGSLDDPPRCTHIGVRRSAGYRW
jgi:hypothetical protein